MIVCVLYVGKRSLNCFEEKRKRIVRSYLKKIELILIILSFTPMIKPIVNVPPNEQLQRVLERLIDILAIALGRR